MEQHAGNYQTFWSLEITEKTEVRSAVAGVGIGMLMGGGVPITEIKKKQSCKVSKFPSFKISNFQRFKVSKFQSSKDSQNAMSCLLIDIEPVSNIFRHMLDRSSGFVGVRLFQNFQI